MRPVAASLLLPLALLLAMPASARSSDRDQPMDISASYTDVLLDDDSVSVLEGNVKIRQGTMEVDAERAEIHRVADEITLTVPTGAPARLHQISDSGEPMDAVAGNIAYRPNEGEMLLTGAVEVRQPRGTLRGERIKYDIDTGRLDGGGDGSRVNMRILPKSRPASGD